MWQGVMTVPFCHLGGAGGLCVTFPPGAATTASGCGAYECGPLANGMSTWDGAACVYETGPSWS